MEWEIPINDFTFSVNGNYRSIRRYVLSKYFIPGKRFNPTHFNEILIALFLMNQNSIFISSKQTCLFQAEVPKSIQLRLPCGIVRWNRIVVVKNLMCIILIFILIFSNEVNTSKYIISMNLTLLIWEMLEGWFIANFDCQFGSLPWFSAWLFVHFLKLRFLAMVVKIGSFKSFFTTMEPRMAKLGRFRISVGAYCKPGLWRALNKD